MYGVICVWLCVENKEDLLSLIEINCQELSTVIESKGDRTSLLKQEKTDL